MRTYKKFFLLAFIVFLSPLFHASAQTNVTDDITSSTTWTQANSPYVVKNSFTVSSGATLTIDPGVVVKFDKDTGIYVTGKLKADGTSSSLITLTSSKDDSVEGDTNGDEDATVPGVLDWSGIYLEGATGSSFKFVKMSYSFSGIAVDNMNISINDTTLSENSGGLLLFNHSTVNLKNFTEKNIYDLGIGVFDGSTLDADTVTLKNMSGDVAVGLFGASNASFKSLTLDTVSFDEAMDLFEGSSLTISDSVIKNIDNSLAIGLFSSSLNMTNTKVESGTGDGVALFDGATLVMNKSTISGFSSGAGVVDYGSSTDTMNNVVAKLNTIKSNKIGFLVYDEGSNLVVTKNSIKGNSSYGVKSQAEGDVNFKNNYWGDASGPYHSTNTSGQGNAISDISGYNKVLFIPFLTAEPTEDACCSSIIFVPGFEGSRLYEKNKKGKLDQKWEPNPFQSDVSNLFMDKDGKSINKNIVTKDTLKRTNYPVGKFNVNVYKSFTEDLDNLKSQSVITDWKDFAYDWRYSVDDIVDNGTMYSDGAHKLQDMISELSKSTNSKTGKVTIVAHSDGGLFVKALLKKLEGTSVISKIDKIILVASPQLGTPSTVAGLLNGDDIELQGGFVMASKTGRKLAENLPGAYGLLPSEKYFSKTNQKVIFLDDSVKSYYSNWISKYGNDLDYSETKDLMTGGDGRKKPAYADTQYPNILSSDILTKEINLHSDIDNLSIPSSIDLYEIAGLGAPTINNITYFYYPFLKAFSRALGFTYLGDGTVVTDSAVDYGSNKSYMNLYKYNQDNNSNFEHKDILENPQVINKIENILTDSTKDTSYLTTTIPTLDIKKPKYVVVKMHSPVDVDIYDGSGNHLGKNNETSVDSDFVQVDKNIPNSNFVIVDNEKYAILPDGGNYTVKLDGTGTGLYTLEVQNVTGDTITNSTIFSDLPVTKSLLGQMTLNTSSGSTPVLKIDENGDGTVDQEINPNDGASPLSYLEVIRTTILDLGLPTNTEKNIIKKIDAIAKLIIKNKIDKASKKMQKFLHNVEMGKKAAKDMTQEERDDLISKINDFLDNL